MPGIVCAIRGGPASQPTIRKAISLAEETGQTLYFLYVVNLDFLGRTTSSRIDTISREMGQMGDFILLLAQTKAHGQGVQAESVVRDGNVTEEIILLCQEVQAEYVVLGRPQDEEKESLFTQERMLRFSQRIETESGAKVVLVEGGAL